MLSQKRAFVNKYLEFFLNTFCQPRLPQNRQRLDLWLCTRFQDLAEASLNFRRHRYHALSAFGLGVLDHIFHLRRAQKLMVNDDLIYTLTKPMKYYITADIHGFYTDFHKALDEAGYFYDLEPHKLIILGDIFNLG